MLKLKSVKQINQESTKTKNKTDANIRKTLMSKNSKTDAKTNKTVTRRTKKKTNQQMLKIKNCKIKSASLAQKLLQHILKLNQQNRC